MDGKAQTPPSERRPGWPQRTSGNGAWATQTYRDVHLLLPQEKLPKPNSIAFVLRWRTGKGSGTSLLAWAAAKARRAFPDPLAPFASVPVSLLQRSEMGSRDHPEITQRSPRDHPEITQRSPRERFLSPSFPGCKRMVRERLVFPQPDDFELESCLLKIGLQLVEPFHDAMVD